MRSTEKDGPNRLEGIERKRKWGRGFTANYGYREVVRGGNLDLVGRSIEPK